MTHRLSPLIMTNNLLLGVEGMDIWHLRPHLAIFVNYDLCVNPQTKDRTYWNQYSLTYNHPRGLNSHSLVPKLKCQLDKICNPSNRAYAILESRPLTLIFDFCTNLSRLKHWLSKLNKIKSKSHEDRRGRGKKGVAAGQQGWGIQKQCLAGDWWWMRFLIDVPPGPLKGLLTHFDYFGPVVTESITSIRTIK